MLTFPRRAVCQDESPHLSSMVKYFKETYGKVPRGFLSRVKRLTARKHSILVRLSVRPLYFPPPFSLPLRMFCPRIIEMASGRVKR